MKAKKSSRSLIVISLIAAGAILLSSYLLADSDFSQTVTFLIIAVWFIPFTILSGRIASHKSKNECE